MWARYGVYTAESRKYRSHKPKYTLHKKQINKTNKRDAYKLYMVGFGEIHFVIDSVIIVCWGGVL